MILSIILRRSRRISSLILPVCVVMTGLFPGGGRAAPVGARFLTIPVGARAVAMGQAFSAVSNDATALWWNPAGIASLPLREVHFSHAELFADTRLEFTAFGVPSTYGSFGFSGLLLTQGAIEARGEDRTKQGTFGASDLALGVSYARPITAGRTLSAGITAKLIRQTLAGESAAGVSFDLGLLWRSPRLSRLSLAITARNLGPTMKFLSEPFSPPATVGVGASYNLIGLLRLASDLSYRPGDQKTVFSMGMEISPVHLLSLRAGYLAKLVSAATTSGGTTGSALSSSSSGSDLTGFSGGMGLRISRYSLDYAILPKQDLGSSHRVSFGAKF